MRNLGGERGLTLPELTVALAVSVIVLAPLGLILWQVTVLPWETSAGSSVAGQVRNVNLSISDDAQSGQRVITGDDPVLATSTWTEFTDPSAKHHDVQYTWDATGDTMLRDSAIDGTSDGSLVVGRSSTPSPM